MLPSIFSPKLTCIPYGENFSYLFVQKILEEIFSPLELAQTIIFVPNHRASITLRQLFSTFSSSLLLPKIISLSDISNNPLNVKEIDELHPAINKWQRLGILSQLIQKLPKYDSVNQSLKSAQKLSTLLDEIQRIGIDTKLIGSLKEQEFAEHHQQNLLFLQIITEEWPRILNDANVIDIQDKLQLSLTALAEHWKAFPPSYKIIIAGSNGSTLGIKKLMKTILNLPQGQIFIQDLNEEEKNKSPSYCNQSTHPQYSIQNLLTFLEINPSEIQVLTSYNKLNVDRSELVKIAMGNENSELSPNFDPRHWPEMVSCRNLKEESKIIALMMRQAIEESFEGDILLVTANQTLSILVTQELNRWGLKANQSEALSITNTPPGHFILSVTNYLKKADPKNLLSLLKHPFYEKTLNRKEHLENVRILEVELLHRHQFEFLNFENNLISKNVELQKWLEQHLAKLVLPFHKTQSMPLVDLINFHINLCHELISSDTEHSLLWENFDGLTLKKILEDIKHNSSHFPFLTWNQYVDLLPTLLKQEENLHEKEGIGSRLHIVGTMESRLSSAKVIILGGLNENSWPQLLQDNPWLNRTMRQKVGLPLSEWYIGLSAQDFCGCFYPPKLYLTRSQEENGNPALPSRWWHRLEAIFKKNQSQLSTIKSSPWQKWQKALIKETVLIKIKAPAPTPPFEARPKQYYVTDIEKLMRDPYSIYAKHCLKIKPLPFFQTYSNSLILGRLIHFILDHYIKIKKDAVTHDLKELLTLSEPYFLSDPIRTTFWWDRYKRLSAWIINQLNRLPIDKRLSEQKGVKSVEINNTEIVIAAIADRIDIDSDLITVIDYKTGTLPSLTDIKKGLYPQLSLEAWLIQNKGFKDIEVDKHSIKVELWHLKGKEISGKIIPLMMDKMFLESVEKELYSLLKTFLDQKTPFLACPIPLYSPSYNEYEHLERLKEWQ